MPDRCSPLLFCLLWHFISRNGALLQRKPRLPPKKKTGVFLKVVGGWLSLKSFLLFLRKNSKRRKPMDWLDFSLKLPITDPTWIFLLVLLIILLAPILLTKLRIPHIIGMILAGLAIGEHGFNILARDSSFNSSAR